MFAGASFGHRPVRERDRPILLAFLSCLCTCAIVGGTLGIFDAQHVAASPTCGPQVVV